MFVSRFFREQRYTLFLLLQKKYMQRIIKKTVVRGVNLTTVLVILTVSIVTIVW